MSRRVCKVKTEGTSLRPDRKVAVLDELLKEIDSKQSDYIKDLLAIVAIPSMSHCPSHWKQIDALMTKFGERIKALEYTDNYELVDIGELNTQSSGIVQRPHVVLATIGVDPKKKTILVYGHLDVAEAVMDEGWKTCPFVQTEVSGQLYGRGTSENKGPILCWLHVLEAYAALKMDPPVNVKLVVEGLRCRGGDELEKLLASRKDFLLGVDCVCLSNSNWLQDKKPCIVYGQRGICVFSMEVEGLKEDVCSKKYGGAIIEPLDDLIYLMDSLTNNDAKIMVPGVLDDVVPPTEGEDTAFMEADFNAEELKKSMGALSLLHKEMKSRLLMHRWRLPVINLHGIHGGYDGKGDMYRIPAKVVGKFSMQIVENQRPETVRQHISNHLQNLWTSRGSPNNVRLEMLSSALPLVEDPTGPCYQAAVRAVKQVYKMDPDMIRQGGTIPIAHALKALTGSAVVMLCVGSGYDNVRAPNEKISIKNYMDGHKLMAAFMHEIAGQFL